MTIVNKIGAGTLALTLALAPLIPISTAATVYAGQQDSDVPSDAEQSLFTKGQNLYLQGRYEPAVGVLNDFLKSYPNSIITDLTLLWLGRSYMQLGRLQEAEQVGRRLRAIKDTPFADIYEGELQTARSETSARGGASLAQNNGPQGTGKPQVAKGAESGGGLARAESPSSPAAVRPAATIPARGQNAGTSGSGEPNGGQSARLVSSLPAGPKVVQIEPARSNNSRRANDRGRRNNAQSQPASGTEGGRPSRQAPNTQIASNNPISSAPVPASTSASPLPMGSTSGPQPNAETVATSAPPAQGGGINLVVRQVPNLVLALRRASEAASPGQSVQLPLTITNTGNKDDQFSVQTDLPAEFQPTFSLAQGGADTGLPILVTPRLARNASLDVLLNLRVPDTAGDGQQRRFFVRAASQSDYQVLKVADGAINIVAAALAAGSEVSQTSVMPGETFTQTIAVKNSGSAPARSSRADFVFNPQFELVSASPSPLVYDRPSRTAIWSLGELGAHESRDIKVTLRALPEALAATSALGRGTLRTQSLPVGTNFDSPSITIGKISRARIDSVSVGLTAIPGDTIYVPFVVRNPGNAADAYELRITAPGAPPAQIYADTNSDGQHQENEPAVTQTPQLTPQGGQFPMLLGVRIPASTADQQRYSYNIVARSLTSSRVASEANTVITVAAPRVRVRSEQMSDNPAPGDTVFYRLVLVNEGSGLAKNLVVTEMLPDALQFVSSEPALGAQDAPSGGQRFTWRVAELAPGDTAVLRIAVRLRPNLSADVTLSTQHTLVYLDGNGNSYRGQ